MDRRAEHPRTSLTGNSDTWTLTNRVPSPRLRRLLERYQGYSAMLRKPIERLELSRGRVVLVVGVGDPLLMGPAHARSELRPYQAFLVGPEQGPLLTRHSGYRLCLDIGMGPWAALEIFGIRSDDLASRPVSLEAVVGPSAGSLADRLADCGAWFERFACMEAFLEQRLARVQWRTTPEIRWAWRQIEVAAGCVRVAWLAQRVGLSHRCFVHRFREQTGLTPKAAARRLRFARAHRVIASGRPRSLGLVAAQCGYSDQSHLTREFHEFAGCSPAAYRRLVRHDAH